MHLSIKSRDWHSTANPAEVKLIAMGKLSTPPHLHEYIEATEHVFAGCPRISGLRLLSAEAADGLLAVRFEGPLDDFRGPYGAVVRLPATRQDPLWSRYTGEGEGTVKDWVYASVALRAVEAHAASQTQDRGYTADNVWWLINDTTNTASGPAPASSAALTEPSPVTDETTGQRPLRLPG